MNQATIVALYGDKPEVLRGFLAACQAEAAAVLGGCFRPYAIPQIHGTIVGLEREEGSGGPVNRNFLRLRQREVAMDYEGVLRLVRDALPFQVQIGGFAEGDQPFLSRGARPFERGFSVHGQNVVIMGWPVTAGYCSGTGAWPPDRFPDRWLYSKVLARLRRGVEEYGVLHAYHDDPMQDDNDFYFRIGTLTGDRPSAGLAGRLSERLRRWLASRRPLFCPVTLADLSVAFYRSPELPCARTEAVRLDVPEVSGATIQDRLG